MAQAPNFDAPQELDTKMGTGNEETIWLGVGTRPMTAVDTRTTRHCHRLWINERLIELCICRLDCG